MKKLYSVIFVSLLAGTILVGACGDDVIVTGPPPKGPVDVQLRLSGMNINVGHVLHINVIASDERLKSRAIIEPLRAAADTIVLAQAAPFGGHRIDMFADVNASGSYESPPNDHSWRLNVPSNGVVTFVRNNNFIDIDDSALIRPGNLFRLDLTGFEQHVGDRFEVHVIDTSNGRTVGLYRIDGLNSGSRSIMIDGVIVDGVGYQVDFYTDVNGNNRYDPPPIDNAWRITFPGSPTGLSIAFPLDSNYTDIGF